MRLTIAHLLRKSANSFITTTATTSGNDDTTSPIDNLDGLLLSEIISFIGPFHYYFIATINRRFQESYLEVFPNKETTINASTLGYAELCCHSICRLRYFDSRKLCASAVDDTGRKLCASAAYHGCLPALKYLRSIDCNWDTSTCSNAAMNDHFHILQWARKQGCPWDTETCCNAAKYGHFHLLQWVRKNGCRWDDRTCSYAAENGHLQILHWARKHGCQWNGMQGRVPTLQKMVTYT